MGKAFLPALGTLEPCRVPALSEHPWKVASTQERHGNQVQPVSRWPRFKSRLCPSLAIKLWEIYLTFLFLSFPI